MAVAHCWNNIKQNQLAEERDLISHMASKNLYIQKIRKG